MDDKFLRVGIFGTIPNGKAGICHAPSDSEDLPDLCDIEDMEICRDEHYVSAYNNANCPTDRPVMRYKILRGKDKIGENLIEIS